MAVQLLDAIRAEIEPLARRLEVLRQMEALAAQLDTENDNDGGGGGGGASTDGRSGENGRTGARASRRPTGVSPAAARPVTARRSSPAGGELGAKTQAVLDVLRARADWMSVSQIAEQLNDGTASSTLRKRLQTLRAGGHVDARGATATRRYRAAGTPDPKPSAKIDADGRALTERVLEALENNGEDASVAHLCDVTGMSRGTIWGALNELRKQGLVRAEGSSSTRRWILTHRIPVGARAAVKQTRDDVFAAVGEHGPALFARLTEITGLRHGQLLGRLHELAKSGRVLQNPDDTWQTTASKDAEIAQRNGLVGTGGKARAGAIAQLRRRAALAIAADPGALTEQRLALALSADREDVALACGGLLEDGDVAMNPDGTYRTTGLGGGPTHGADGGVMPAADGALAA